MRIRTLQHRSHGVSKLNVTPLIDVVMVLIIFFLIVGKLASEHGAKVHLPDSPAGKVEQDIAKVVVNIASPKSGETEVIVDGISLTLPQLEEFLTRRRSREPDSQVLLRADRTLKYGDIAPIVSVARKVGFSSIRLVTERQAGGAP